MESTPETIHASIIIATYNRCKDLKECLESLPWPQFEKEAVEVIVVADGCQDGTAEMIQQGFPRVLVLCNDVNKGPAFCRNLGAHTARGKLLLYVDDDVVVAPGWLETMLAADDGKTILGGRILNFQDGKEQGGPAFSTFLGKRLPCPPAKATVGTSCNLGIPRACFSAVAGFDEDLPYYFEDSDICIRGRKAGFKFRYLAGAVVRHKGTREKRGKAIQMQEHNSTYAMLKMYRGRPAMLFLFTLGNGAWMILRLFAWGMRFRFQDCRLLFNGWCSAYRRYRRPANPNDQFSTWRP